MGEQCCRRSATKGVGESKQVTWWWLAPAVLLLSACAAITKDSSDESKRAYAAEQAKARWTLVIKGDPGAAYDQFMSEGSRQVINRSDFVGIMMRTVWKSADVQKVECASEVCKVTIEVKSDFRENAKGAVRKGISVKDVPLTLVESWTIEGGRMWYVWSP